MLPYLIFWAATADVQSTPLTMVLLTPLLSRAWYRNTGDVVLVRHGASHTPRFDSLLHEFPSVVYHGIPIWNRGTGHRRGISTTPKKAIDTCVGPPLTGSLRKLLVQAAGAFPGCSLQLLHFTTVATLAIGATSSAPLWRTCHISALQAAMRLHHAFFQSEITFVL